jgi:hypothetical protein
VAETLWGSSDLTSYLDLLLRAGWLRVFEPPKRVIEATRDVADEIPNVFAMAPEATESDIEAVSAERSEGKVPAEEKSQYIKVRAPQGNWCLARWVVIERYLIECVAAGKPEPTLASIIKCTRKHRTEVYGWLRGKNKPSVAEAIERVCTREKPHLKITVRRETRQTYQKTLL